MRAGVLWRLPRSPRSSTFAGLRGHYTARDSQSSLHGLPLRLPGSISFRTRMRRVAMACPSP
eukprot:1639941-Lingulodinium_polyedra.AAC.1